YVQGLCAMRRSIDETLDLPLMQLLPPHTFKLAFIAAVLAGCGGGGDGGSGVARPDQGGNDPRPGNGGNVILTVACTDTSFLCSGRSIRGVDDRVVLTDNAVQVYALSTSDLDRATNPDHTIATGLMLPDCTSSTNCGV